MSKKKDGAVHTAGAMADAATKAHLYVAEVFARMAAIDTAKKRLFADMDAEAVRDAVEWLQRGRALFEVGMKADDPTHKAWLKEPAGIAIYDILDKHQRQIDAECAWVLSEGHAVDQACFAAGIDPMTTVRTHEEAEKRRAC